VVSACPGMVFASSLPSSLHSETMLIDFTLVDTLSARRITNLPKAQKCEYKPNITAL
jgi:hypothetical protein